jgi:hypothetical protein
MARGLHKMVVKGKMLTSISVDLDCTVINLPTYPGRYSVDPYATELNILSLLTQSSHLHTLLKRILAPCQSSDK